jgi:hypothetical protein
VFDVEATCEFERGYTYSQRLEKNWLNLSPLRNAVLFGIELALRFDLLLGLAGSMR